MNPAHLLNPLFRWFVGWVVAAMHTEQRTRKDAAHALFESDFVDDSIGAKRYYYIAEARHKAALLHWHRASWWWTRVLPLHDRLGLTVFDEETPSPR